MDNALNLSSKRRRATSVLSLIVLWGLMVAGGYIALVRYASTPGNERTPPRQIPAGMELELALVKDRPSLLVFIHPRCPCSFATIAELDRLLTEVNVSLNPIILLGCPESERETWTQSPLATRCHMTHSATVVVDPDGKLAARMNATTSGLCILYSADGELLLHGGITTGRGHEGESLGRVAIRDILRGRGSCRQRLPAFGCELVGNSTAIEPKQYCGKRLELP